ncbi:MAG: tetratricopeptide repeat protein [Planctomycetota bacterium]
MNNARGPRDRCGADRAIRLEQFAEESQKSLQSAAEVAYAALRAGWLDAVERLTTEIGREDPVTILALTRLAEGYVQSSEYDTALPVLRETVRLNASVHGQSHLETIGAQNALAQALTDMTEFEETEAIYGETLSNAMRGYGPDHPITLKTRGNTACHEYLSKDFEAAAATGEPLLEDMIRVLGEEHQATGNTRNTRNTRNTLALAYEQLLRWDESEALQRTELQIARNTLGKLHPSTMNSMTNLGSIL